MYGAKALLMSDTDFRCYVMDVVDYVSKYFKAENYKPTLEEFIKQLLVLIEEDFMELNKQEVEAILYQSPDDCNKSITILTPEQFFELVEREYDIKELYDEFFG